MPWTHTPPSSPGWYWLHLGASDERRAVLLEPADDVSIRLLVRDPRKRGIPVYTAAYERPEFANRWWDEPIEPPGPEAVGGGRWSDSRVSRPGWYWVRPDDGSHARLVFVEPDFASASGLRVWDAFDAPSPTEIFQYELRWRGSLWWPEAVPWPGSEATNASGAAPR